MLRSQASAPDSNASRRRTPGAILRCRCARDPAPPGSPGSVPFDRRNGGPPGLPRHRYAKAETEVPVELDGEPVGRLPLEIEALSRAFRFIFPPFRNTRSD